MKKTNFLFVLLIALILPAVMLGQSKLVYKVRDMALYNSITDEVKIHRVNTTLILAKKYLSIVGFDTYTFFGSAETVEKDSKFITSKAINSKGQVYLIVAEPRSLNLTYFYIVDKSSETYIMIEAFLVR